MEITDATTSNFNPLGDRQAALSALPAAVVDHAGQDAETAALDSDAKMMARWERYGKFPVDLSVSFPLEEITLSHLADLRPGMVLRSAWPAAEDVPLSTGEVFLANVSFEPVGTRLGVRLSGFAPRPAPTVKRPVWAGEMGVEGTETEETEGAQVQALDALKDLWLSLSVCVGTVQMPVEEILQWTVGDTIPLNRPVNAPVNLLLKERIVASGDLVLVAGFYAVQLTEIAPRSRRLPLC